MAVSLAIRHGSLWSGELGMQLTGALIICGGQTCVLGGSIRCCLYVITSSIFQADKDERQTSEAVNYLYSEYK